MARKNRNVNRGLQPKRKGRRKKKKTPPWNAKPHTEREERELDV